jgi:hypothetical protein
MNLGPGSVPTDRAVPPAITPGCSITTRLTNAASVVRRIHPESGRNPAWQNHRLRDSGNFLGGTDSRCQLKRRFRLHAACEAIWRTLRDQVADPWADPPLRF